MLVGKSRGGTPFCRTLKTVFPKRSSSRNTTRIRFGKAGAHPQLALGIAIAPETLFHHYNLLILKAIAILSICLQILVQFHLLRKCGLLAHTSPTFLKNCWIKKLFGCLRLVLGKPLAYGSARLGHIPSLPGNRNCP